MRNSGELTPSHFHRPRVKPSQLRCHCKPCCKFYLWCDQGPDLVSLGQSDAWKKVPSLRCLGVWNLLCTHMHRWAPYNGRAEPPPRPACNVVLTEASNPKVEARERGLPPSTPFATPSWRFALTLRTPLLQGKTRSLVFERSSTGAASVQSWDHGRCQRRIVGISPERHCHDGELSQCPLAVASSLHFSA